MRLSDKALDEFRAIYRAEFGEDLTVDAANEMGLRLLRIFDLISRPLPSTQTLIKNDTGPSI